ncbi:hypothetical protein, partial [Mesorhizobium sp.]|uniref:hypothetical protein n=1 Tax=Mesorhizobium sp. TaxID=1871066 RepID=UPI0025F924B9
EKVDRRAAPRRKRGVGRSAVAAKLEHPSSDRAEPLLGLAEGKTLGSATFSHKGRRQDKAQPASTLVTNTSENWPFLTP